MTTFDPAYLIDRGLMSEIPDVPDTRVYQLNKGWDDLIGATTTMPGGSLLDAFVTLANPGNTNIPISVSSILEARPFAVVPIGSDLDVALSGFPRLVTVVASYKSEDEMALEATPTALPSVSGLVKSGQCEYLGYSVRETSGTTNARVVLHDSLDATGRVLEEITLTYNESASDEYNRPGRLVSIGIYAVITGAVEGSIFT